MGLNVSESITMSSGITVSSYYAALGNEDIEISKSQDNTQYNISGSFILWKDQAARQSGKSPIGSKLVETSSTTTNVDVYAKLYEQYKTTLTNYTDV